MTNIVIFSGGRGSKSLIESLNKLNINKNISTIINLYDDGKSSGMVRSLFNMPGPSDARKVQEIFLKNNLLTQDYQKKLFEYRVSTTHLDFLRELNDFINKNSNNLFSIKIKNFKFRKSIKKYIKKFLFLLKNKFINTNDLSLINILYVGAFFYYKKNINLTIKKISELFGIKNEIVSCGTKILHLSGINNNDKIFYSEEEIVEQRSNTNMKDIFLTKNNLENLKKSIAKNTDKIKIIRNLEKRDKISFNALNLIQKADIIIYSPGTPFSSLYPSYFVRGVGEIIKKNKNAKKIMITNIGSDYETPKFSANDYIKNTIKFLNRDNTYKSNELITHCIINDTSSKKKYYVKSKVNNTFIKNFKIIKGNYENKLIQGTHDANKLSKTLQNIILN